MTGVGGIVGRVSSELGWRLSSMIEDGERGLARVTGDMSIGESGEIGEMGDMAMRSGFEECSL